MKTKYFDVDEALDKAVNTFWSKGYEAASMQVLLDEMGIRRQSLYDTFGNKHDLFLSSLDYYHANVIVKNFAQIIEAKSPIKGIKDYFYQRINDLDDPGIIPGCLVTNSLAELGLSDESVKMKTKRTLEYMEKVFNGALNKAQDLGEISPNKNTKLLATQLLNNAQGLFIMSKSGMSKSKLKTLTKEFLKVLD